MNLEKCPKEECWFWEKPGTTLDASDGIYPNVSEALKNGKWFEVIEEGCYCNLGKCNRLYEDGDDDYYEPNDMVILEKKKKGTI